ncbi:hypothetical protein Mp_1g28230 [Marchantia polymorpha subsp. ruderalis]|uniref:Uncharacterized protein n=2 Tax=Marchantia polymorpha TaxID=3197 RepID=A0AAF6AV58_MARPO|nr:hypothetical protein MARPO_0002s0055 [Marchantia polymorpha]BBN00329.1 hypothetical protein Mp_1g28230 [Marchantia polymorpha subsp. ruderalis]|eukprot:PTQ49553.1 hypothetical protein MARPO_0002s0055 [Marchantia polymorpha]
MDSSMTSTRYIISWRLQLRRPRPRDLETPCYVLFHTARWCDHCRCWLAGGLNLSVGDTCNSVLVDGVGEQRMER